MASKALGGGTFQKRAEQMAAARGLSFVDFLCRVIEEQGSLAGAAHYLNVNRNSIRYHLKRAGIKVETSYTTKVKP